MHMVLDTKNRVDTLLCHNYANCLYLYYLFMATIMQLLFHANEDML